MINHKVLTSDEEDSKQPANLILFSIYYSYNYRKHVASQAHGLPRASAFIYVV